VLSISQDSFVKAVTSANLRWPRYSPHSQAPPQSAATEKAAAYFESVRVARTDFDSKAPRHPVWGNKGDLVMSTILIVVLVILLLGGFGGYHGYNRYGGAGLGGVLGLILIVVLVLWLAGGVHV
jgi:hypothetical protein